MITFIAKMIFKLMVHLPKVWRALPIDLRIVLADWARRHWTL